METSKVISSDKATVVRLKVTQENVIFVDGQETGGTNHNTVLKGFLTLQPKALGTVQVMIGVIIFFFGFLLTITDYNYDAILVYSGITYWGSLIYISAGSLSVAAQNKLHPYVVKSSFGMNLFSAITAGLSIILMFEQLRLTAMKEPSLYDEYFILRVVGIMLVFTISQFLISICISAFACKATCNRDTVVNVLLKDTESQ